MYDYLEQEKPSLEEQKGCRRGSRGKKNHLLIDKIVLNDCKKRHNNLSMTWIDYNKAYDFVLHSWINESMELLRIANNVKNVLEKSTKQWKLLLTCDGKDLGEVDMKRGILQGDSLSPLFFVLSMVPLSLIPLPIVHGLF